MSGSSRCQVFIGSSSEGKLVAEALQAQLLAHCEVVLWDQGVFVPGRYTLENLIGIAHRSDFAVLVATPDDMRESRGLTTAVPRDNVILEFGLFAGVLGRERTLVLATDGALLPSDTLGLTRLTYHAQQNLRSAVSVAANEVLQLMDQLKMRESRSPSGAGNGDVSNTALVAEIAKLTENAVAQGWKVKNTPTTLRLVSPKGRTFTLSKSTQAATRNALRGFVARLRAGGLRVNDALRRPPAESPFS